MLINEVQLYCMFSEGNDITKGVIFCYTTNIVLLIEMLVFHYTPLVLDLGATNCDLILVMLVRVL